ncbi:hypothetical protein COOONC_27512 [Cooperia oncophora]
MNATALLDTGSQTTIIPVKLLKRAVDSSVDLDEYIERIPGPKVTVRDASGNVMKFLDTVRVAVTLGEQLEFISAYVGKGPDEVIILRGTTAKRELLTISSEEPDKDDFKAAGRVKERTYIPAKAIRTLTLTCARANIPKSPVLCSNHPLIPDGVCRAAQGDEVSIPVINDSNQGIIFKKGEVIGEWEEHEWIRPKHVEPDRDMLDLNRPNEGASAVNRIKTLVEIVQRKNTLPAKRNDEACNHHITLSSTEFTHLIWSYSLLPGYNGQPRKSSAMTHPRDHISIASRKGKPSMISGAL